MSREVCGLLAKCIVLKFGAGMYEFDGCGFMVGFYLVWFCYVNGRYDEAPVCVPGLPRHLEKSAILDGLPRIRNYSSLP